MSIITIKNSKDEGILIEQLKGMQGYFGFDLSVREDRQNSDLPNKSKKFDKGEDKPIPETPEAIIPEITE